MPLFERRAVVRQSERGIEVGDVIMPIGAREFEQQGGRMWDDVGLETQVAIGACANAYALLGEHFCVSLRANFDVNY